LPDCCIDQPKDGLICSSQGRAARVSLVQVFCGCSRALQPFCRVPVCCWLGRTVAPVCLCCLVCAQVLSAGFMSVFMSLAAAQPCSYSGIFMLGFVAFSCSVGGSSYYLFSAQHRCLLPPPFQLRGITRRLLPGKDASLSTLVDFHTLISFSGACRCKQGLFCPAGSMPDKHGAVTPVPSCPACSQVSSCLCGLGCGSLCLLVACWSCKPKGSFCFRTLLNLEFESALYDVCRIPRTRNWKLFLCIFLAEGRGLL